MTGVRPGGSLPDDVTGTVQAPARFVVDPWDPGYAGSDAGPAGDGMAESEAPLDLEVELPVAQWAPIGVQVDPAGLVHFVDGVRRIDARVWFAGGADASPALPGIAASYAAGVVSCDGTAAIGAVVVARGIFTAAGPARGVTTPGGLQYVLHRGLSGELADLTAAMQAQMRELEITAAKSARAGEPEPDPAGALSVGDDILVVDGPLRGREWLPRAVGYIKTHQAAYLPPELLGVVARLGPGERTPVFTIGSRWSRHTWYQRLPGPRAHAWAGIVRCEAAATLTGAQAIWLANLASATLPQFASDRHKDGRAPQNLYPIAGLERHLRHRLGDRDHVLRELTAAQ